MSIICWLVCLLGRFCKVGDCNLGFGKKYFCLVDFLRFIYKMWVVFGRVLRLAAGNCSNIVNLLEKPRKYTKNLVVLANKKD